MLNSRRLEYVDLVVCIGLALYVAVSGILGVTDAARVIAGILFIFTVPGYALSQVVWRGVRGFRLGDRIIFSVGLSVSLVILTLLLLSVAGLTWSALIVSVVVSYEALLFSIEALLIRRRRREGFPPDIAGAAHSAKRMFDEDRIFWTFVMVLLVLGAAIASAVVLIPPPAGSTRFYLLGPDGTTGSVPSQISVDENATLLVGVSNGEGRDLSLTVRACVAVVRQACNSTSASYASWDDILVFDPPQAYVLNLSLGDGQGTERPLLFQVSQAGTYVFSLELGGAGDRKDLTFPMSVLP